MSCLFDLQYSSQTNSTELDVNVNFQNVETTAQTQGSLF